MKTETQKRVLNALVWAVVVALLAALIGSLAGCAGLPRTLYDVDPVTGESLPVQEIPYYVGGVELFSAAPAGPDQDGDGWLGGLLGLAGPYLPLLGLLFPRVRQNLAGAATSALSLKPLEAGKHLLATTGLTHTPSPPATPAGTGA
jgi:hypothetical protein